MAIVYAKTAAGQAEIRARSQVLQRQARTLLVLADGTRTREQLLKMVQGAAAADLDGLIDAGLLSAVSGAGRAPAPETVPPPDAEAESDGLDYQEVYDGLNALVREQLGLIKGFRYALEIEKADGLPALREVAQRFADDVHRANGEKAAQMVRRALALPR